MFRSLVGGLVCLLVLSACDGAIELEPPNENETLFMERLDPYCGLSDISMNERTCDAFLVREGGAVAHISGLRTETRRAIMTLRGQYNRVVSDLSYTDSEFYNASAYRIVGPSDPDYEEVRQRYLNQIPY